VFCFAEKAHAEKFRVQFYRGSAGDRALLIATWQG
jgi:hypothetical protein